MQELIAAARRNTIGDAFSRSAAKFAGRVALRFHDRDWTFQALHQAAGRAAHWLSIQGARPGDRVVCFGRNSDAYYIAWLACCFGGFVHVPLNYALTARELDYVLGQCQARLLLYDPDLHEAVGQVSTLAVRAQPFEAVLAAAKDPALDASFRAEGLNEHTLAQLLYTSGTTGAPKGAMMTHGAFLTEYFACMVECAYAPEDVALAALPLYHSAQMHAFTTPQMLVGAATTLIESPAPDTVLKLIEERGVTSFFAPPTVWINLLRHPSFDQRDLRSLQKLYYGAAIMPEPVLQELRQRLPQARLFNCYGQSEIGPVATVLKPEEHEQRPTSAGRPMMSVETRVVDVEMRDVPAGEPGEIVHRSPQLLVGYWAQEEETREAFRGGWFHSGDVGVRDAEGFLYVVDRLKDVINTGGVLVASREVEDVLLRHPAVSEAAVIALPDPIWGEAISAVVVLREHQTTTEAALIDHARGVLAPFKLPKRVMFAESLPRNTAGKVLKRELRLTFSR